jgi:hypothetical protein
MNTDTATMANPSRAQEAAAALHAMTEQAKTENLALVAALSDDANNTHIAEHIRGMVALTIGHLSLDAPATTRNHAAQWQAWALGVADGVVPSVPAAI